MKMLTFSFFFDYFSQYILPSYIRTFHFVLLEKLIHYVQVLIVIHGGSFTLDEDIIRMIDLGAAKINIGTELMMEFVNSIKAMLCEKNQDVSAKELLGHAQRCVEKLVKRKIRTLNTLRTASTPQG